ncbi:MAG TPA: hemerythrin domain-containing protein [Noviherbaspirillum sp.]|nr:hemerythrin domain-containing protein [Noviherbaspirillum sp.]
METITGYLATDHKRCDDFFASAETSVSKKQWAEAEASLKDFSAALERHFTMEEKVLFPEFEAATGSTQGPTSVMRMEHQQMRSIVAMLREALDQRDVDNFLGHSDTLNTMMQQHNMKEESILYVMSERVLSGQQHEIIGAMSEIGATV